MHAIYWHLDLLCDLAQDEDPASSAVDDYSSELVPDNDLGVLWGSPIISVVGDLQPIEAYHLMDPAAKRHGLAFKHWLRDKYRHMHRMYSQTTNFPSARHFCDLERFFGIDHSTRLADDAERAADAAPAHACVVEMSAC